MFDEFTDFSIIAEIGDEGGSSSDVPAGGERILVGSANEVVGSKLKAPDFPILQAKPGAQFVQCSTFKVVATKEVEGKPIGWLEGEVGKEVAEALSVTGFFKMNILIEVEVSQFARDEVAPTGLEKVLQA